MPRSLNIVNRTSATLLAIALVLLACGVTRTSPATAQSRTGSIYRWGSFGLGSNANDESSRPVPVSRMTNFVEVAAGNASDIALDANGDVWTWGDGAKGVLGDGSTENQLSSAVQVYGLPTIIGIAEADDTDVALAANGTVWGWGWNEAGQLCLGNETEYRRPVELSVSRVVAMAGAGTHMLYLLANGGLEGGGETSDGQL